jgi:predicted HicB family RNase H-like nuclease
MSLRVKKNAKKPKRYYVFVRMTRQEHDAFMARAKKASLSVNAYARRIFSSTARSAAALKKRAAK